MEDLLTHHGAVAFGTTREIHRHMDSEEAERYLMGGSAEIEAAELEAHLMVCAPCRERISETDLYLSSMYDAAEEVRAHPEKTDWPRSQRWSGAAAGAGILMLGLLTLRYYPPPVEVTLNHSGPAIAPAGKGLALRLDRAGDRLEIVTAAGETAWRGELETGKARAAVPGQRSGTYRVRVLSGSGEIESEYRLVIH